MTSAPSGQSLRERQRERTRGDVLRAALELISADGTDATTIDRIALGAGMSRGTLYAHYPGGLDEIIRCAYDRLGADLLMSAETRAANRDEWIDRLMAFAEAMIELAQDPELGFFYNISGPGRVGLHRVRGTSSEAYRDAFRAELVTAQGDGLIALDVDAATTAALLVGMMRQAGIDVARDASIAPTYRAAFRRTLEALARP